MLGYAVRSRGKDLGCTMAVLMLMQLVIDMLVELRLKGHEEGK